MQLGHGDPASQTRSSPVPADAPTHPLGVHRSHRGPQAVLYEWPMTSDDAATLERSRTRRLARAAAYAAVTATVLFGVGFLVRSRWDPLIDVDDARHLVGHTLLEGLNGFGVLVGLARGVVVGCHAYPSRVLRAVVLIRRRQSA